MAVEPHGDADPGSSGLGRCDPHGQARPRQRPRRPRGRPHRARGQFPVMSRSAPDASTETRARVPSRVPVLTYHSLDESGSVISIAPSVFRDQMQALAARGFTGVTVGQLVDAWNGAATLPERPVVLTFDD